MGLVRWAARAGTARLVPFGRRIAGRAAVSADKIRRYLSLCGIRLLREAQNKIGRVAAKKIATGWMKFVPVLNVLSTAYDIYDIASTGYDIYKTIDQALGRFSKTRISTKFSRIWPLRGPTAR